MESKHLTMRFAIHMKVVNLQKKKLRNQLLFCVSMFQSTLFQCFNISIFQYALPCGSDSETFTKSKNVSIRTPLRQ